IKPRRPQVRHARHAPSTRHAPQAHATCTALHDTKTNLSEHNVRQTTLHDTKTNLSEHNVRQTALQDTKTNLSEHNVRQTALYDTKTNLSKHNVRQPLAEPPCCAESDCKCRGRVNTALHRPTLCHLLCLNHFRFPCCCGDTETNHLVTMLVEQLHKHGKEETVDIVCLCEKRCADGFLFLKLIDEGG
ncbi:Hypothetical protein, putative, partial [Bodo saltans]